MADPIPNAPANVPNYLIPAILTTLCCCLPFGVVGIVFAAQVNGKLAAGDYAGAVRTSNQAKIWCWVSFGIGLLQWLAFIACVVVPFVAALASAGPGAHNIHVR